MIFGSLSSSAGPDEPAGQGRPITPAGTLVQDLTTRQTAVGALPVAFVRTPDKTGPGGEGRFLLSVNSGYGLQFQRCCESWSASRFLLSIWIRMSGCRSECISHRRRERQCRCSVRAKAARRWLVRAHHVSNGLKTRSGSSVSSRSRTPITPASPGPNTNVEAPFIDVSGFTFAANSPRYNSDRAPVYPAGIARILRTEIR